MSKWRDGRWWRVVDNAGLLWCETSNIDEALDALDTCPGKPATLERQQIKPEERWVLTDPGTL